jgi:hypothetical protein
MTQELSPAAWATLNAVTQHQYDLNPEDIPNEATRIACEISIALRKAIDQVMPKEDNPSGDWTDIDEAKFQLLTIANELEAQ